MRGVHKMKKLIIGVITLLSLLAVTGCGKAFVPTSWASEKDTAYLAASESVVSVLEGIVGSKISTVDFPPQGDRHGARYSYWFVVVQQYLVDPLLYECITIRIYEDNIYAESFTPDRFAYHLIEGEHAIFFLEKEDETFAEDNVFTPAPGFVALGKVPIEQGKVSVKRNQQVSVEPVENFITRIQRYAMDAGRNVSSPVSRSE